ncbi:ABC-three component system middle component 5 [Algihabitans albus]|uniref:ABC-three component system middle component 5 n=1 Tax=Algihabitans albus TaxID=2164067 RepID=UPI0035D03413
MIGRLWYPQLDVYDAIRRIAGLLALWNAGSLPSKERLHVADFYLANPPLLYKTHMMQEVRREFYQLNIKRPEKIFISYPSAPLLFQKMGEVQRQALRTIIGKGLIDLPSLERGIVAPSPLGRNFFDSNLLALLNDNECRLADFLANSFATSEQKISDIRRNTGLRRVSR